MSLEWNVNSALPVSYQVKIVDGLFELNNRALLEAGITDQHESIRRLIVIDDKVNQLYGEQIRQYLEHHGVIHHVISLSVSEMAKTIDSVLRVVKGIDEFEVSRRHEPIIAIGGGVLLDIVGLAASLYRRSTPWVRVPTTLIGLVDAGVGAKTGVNFGNHKNRIGSYFPARATLLDRSFLKTMNTRHISNGLAEILKIALVKNRRLFELLEQHGATLIEERLQGKTEVSDRATIEIIECAITGMIEELEANLWEHKLERLVDFGHSFGPEIEMAALPELLHGEAVNIDMALTTVISVQRGLITPQEQKRIFALMHQLHLPLYHPLCETRLLVKALAETVRHRNGLQRLPLGIGIGMACFVNDLQESELVHASESLRQLATADFQEREITYA